jgi:hypothetical protein
MKTELLEPIQLEEMDRVKLMNRTDKKYWFHYQHLPQILYAIRNEYFILEINSESKLPYTTTYYDTTNNNMFTEHHNGKLNRYKVRRRSYVSSGISFLEIKFKNNKGRTIKKRISSEFGNTTFTTQEREFLSRHIPFNPNELHPTLINNFSRLTLVNKNFKERCTIDLNLRFEIANKTAALSDLVIVEIKSDGKIDNSPLAKALFDLRIKPSGFSKYCVGRTLTNGALKRNAFKGKIRRIEKTIKSNNNLYHFN